MIALDTNVLIRVLIADDPKQTALSERLLREAVDAGSIWGLGHESVSLRAGGIIGVTARPGEGVPRK